MSNKLIAKLSQKLDILKNLEERCVKGILPDEEGRTIAGQIAIDISELLPEDSAVFHIHRKFLRNTMWWSSMENGYADYEYLQKFKKIRSHIEDLIEELQPSFLQAISNEDQYYFSSGQEFEAQKKVFDLMKRASKNLAIIDPYLDETIFDYIGSLDSLINIKLLTGTKKPIFPKLLAPFKKNRSNIEAKECSDCHDRFIIVDDIEIWQLGSSINHIAESATTINKIESLSDNYKKLESDFNTWWNKGSVIQ